MDGERYRGAKLDGLNWIGSVTEGMDEQTDLSSYRSGIPFI